MLGIETLGPTSKLEAKEEYNTGITSRGKGGKSPSGKKGNEKEKEGKGSYIEEFENYLK
jgi:hypothetical protein